MNPIPYETKYDLIDESLPSRRNKIAHGKCLDIDFKDFDVLSKEIPGLVRNFKTDLENTAVDKS